MSLYTHITKNGEKTTKEDDLLVLFRAIQSHLEVQQEMELNGEFLPTYYDAEEDNYWLIKYIH